ncbi:unnamed protein product [Macrosiphum euphorbiae]|uniref:Uncharacterized protein n=1 Tax=Macrosiphum euphorbiae TaxID=13131 RepID=A0AAV0XS25_9HEMI|nr:unnamed protein product [Macrosiphum euphorbiae]
MTTLTCPTNEKKSSAAGNKPPSSPGFRVSKITFFYGLSPAWLTSPHLPGRLHTLVFVKRPADHEATELIDKQPTSENLFQLPSTYCDTCDRSP